MQHVRFGRRFAIALVVSLALHAAFVPFARQLPQAIAEQRPPDVISFVTAEPRRPVRTPAPTPPPTPHPVVTPHRIVHAPVRLAPRTVGAAAPAAVHAPIVAAVASGAPVERAGTATTPPGAPGPDASAAANGLPADGDPGAEPSVEPAPSETPRPACSRTPSDARVTNTIEPETPGDARRAGALGTTIVRVDLSDGGAVLGVSIYRSSGSYWLDRSALDAARRSTYAAATVSCRAEPGSYLFRAEFDG